jgi:nitric oxide reductase large subunit
VNLAIGEFGTFNRYLWAFVDGELIVNAPRSLTLGRLWSWFGDQGWEYLDLGRAWQIMLAAGLVLWVVLLYRARCHVRRI